MQKYISFRLLKILTIGIAAQLLLVGCLTDSKSDSVTGSSISVTEFSGITKVTNLNGPLQIEWTASSAQVSGYNIYHQNSEGDFDIVGNVGPEITSFIHGSSGSSNSAFIGKIHTYKVKAIDKKNKEDGNTKVLSQISYSGILSSVATSKSTAEVTVPAISPSFDEIRIYAAALTLNETPQLVATIKSDKTTATINGLKSGITYLFTAQGYSEYLNKEDGNTATITQQMPGFTSEGYLGFFNIQAYGPAPNAPDFQPKQELVVLSWVNFLNGNSGTRYRVIRTPKDGYFNTNPKLTTGLTDYCTKTSSNSCVVQDCASIAHKTDGSIGPSCIDTQVGLAPSVYDYTVVMLQGSGMTEYAEEVEVGNQDLYRVRVQIPPKNMALVSRDAVNFEMCTLLHSQSDPKVHQRCSYTSYGSAPLNSGPGKPALGLSPNYYDFGYNLFVDRWELGCDYDEVLTIASTGGNLYLNAATYEGKVAMVPMHDRADIWGPSGYKYSSICRLSRNSKWYGSWYASAPANPMRNFQEILSDPTVKKLFTNDPITRSGKKTVSHAFEISQAWDACQTQEDPNYGKKRLPRMREYRAYAAFPWIPGEVLFNGTSLFSSNMNSTQYTNKMYTSSSNTIGGASFESRGCGTFGATSVSNGDSPPPVDQAALLVDLTDRNTKNRWPSWKNGGDIYPAGYFYGFIGSNASSGCVTRYGIQDTVGNQKEYVSDKLGECNPRPISNLYRSTYNLCFTSLDSRRCEGYTMDFVTETSSLYTSPTTGYNCSLVAPGVPGNCPAATQTLPSSYIKYCTGTGGGLDSGNVDLSPYALNPMLSPYSYRITNTNKDFNNYKLKDKVVFGPYFNPTLGIPLYADAQSYTYTPAYGASSDFTKTFDASPGDLTSVDYLNMATAGGATVALIGAAENIAIGDRGHSQQNEYSGSNYAKRILVGGSSNSGNYSGRWYTDIKYAHAGTDYYYEDMGARCVLPAE